MNVLGDERLGDECRTISNVYSYPLIESFVSKYDLIPFYLYQQFSYLITSSPKILEPKEKSIAKDLVVHPVGQFRF